MSRPRAPAHAAPRAAPRARQRLPQASTERRPSRSDWARIALIGAAVVLVAAIAAVVVGARGPKVLGARSDVLIVPPPAAPLDARDRDLATQRELIGSRAVLAPVAARSGMAVERLQREVSVEAGARNDLLHITVGDVSAVRARRLARDVTAQYVALAARIATGADGERRAIDREITRLTARADRASPAEAAVIRARVDGLEARRLPLDEQRSARPTVLSAPYLLADRLSPKPWRALAVGLIAGLALAAGAVALLARQVRSAKAP